MKVLKEYAEVCGSVMMKSCVLNLIALLSHSQSIALCLVQITYSLSLSFILSIFYFKLYFIQQVDIKEPERD